MATEGGERSEPGEGSAETIIVKNYAGHHTSPALRSRSDFDVVHASRPLSSRHAALAILILGFVKDPSARGRAGVCRLTDRSWFGRTRHRTHEKVAFPAQECIVPQYYYLSSSKISVPVLEGCNR